MMTIRRQVFFPSWHQSLCQLSSFCLHRILFRPVRAPHCSSHYCTSRSSLRRSRIWRSLQTDGRHTSSIYTADDFSQDTQEIAVNVRSGEDLIMALHTPVTERILGQVQRTQGCDLDSLTKSLSDLSWGQVFLEVDRLSREGQVLVTLDTGGRYMIRLPDHSRIPESHYIRSS